MSKDTICAIATPPGRGGVAIIRVSGPDTGKIVAKVAGPLPKPRQAVLRHFVNAEHEAIDSGLLLSFPGPNSFTGEDVAELQGHGGAVVSNMVLTALVNAGARLARPGEFSERAFLNDKLDLAQAEAIVDLVDAGSEAAARAAQQSLSGSFSSHINQLLADLIRLRVHVESAIDFPEEEIDFLADDAIAEQLARVTESIAQLLAQAERGRVLRDGLRVTLCGKPNAGKSSLLNALATEDVAIVTAEAGTTRDVLRQQISIAGVPLHISDTAGLRDADNAIEAEGIRRAQSEIHAADCVLLLADDNLEDVDQLEQELLSIEGQQRCIRVINKIDQTQRQPGIIDHRTVAISAKQGIAIEQLGNLLLESLQIRGSDDVRGQFSARQRHLQLLQQVNVHLQAAHVQLHDFHAGELLADELLQAQNALGEITGKFVADDLLGEIFSNFCIGK